MGKNMHLDETELKYVPKTRHSKNNFESPAKRHHCTDILCTIIFLIFIITLIFVSIVAYTNGKPQELILPHDSSGRLCGRTKGLENRPYLLFYDLTKCLSFLSAINGCPTQQVCVEECPKNNAYQKIQSNQDIIKKYCDPFNSTICPKYLVKSKPIFGRCVPEIVANILNSSVDIIQAFDPTKDEYIPIQLDDNENLTSKTLKNAVNYLKNLLNLKRLFELALEDLTQTYWLILIALAITALISFIWIFVLRFLIKPLVYLSIIFVLGLLSFATYFSVQEYLNLRKNSTKSNEEFKFKFEKLYDFDYMKNLKETWLAFSIIFGFLLLILFLIIIFLRNRIRLACQLIEEVSKAVVCIPSSLIWPIIPFLLQLGIFFYCISVCIFLASSGVQLYQVIDTNSSNYTNFTSDIKFEIKVGDYCIPDKFTKLKETLDNPIYDSYECTFYRYGYNTTLPVGVDSMFLNNYYSKAITILNNYQWIPQVYVVFMLFWLSAFTTGLNQMTLAGSFGEWYWTHYDKSNKIMIPFFTVFFSFLRAITFHFGTLAFGSLLIAIIKLIRLFLEYLSNKLKSKREVNKIAKFLLSCLKCCFWCLERFIKFLNRYAFIITATYSLNFCNAARKAFKLITTNALRIVIVDKVTNFILFLSNLTITFAIGILSFYFFTKKIPFDAITNFSPDLNYYFLPIIVIIIGSYLITKLFFDVFTMGVDSILICVLIDLDENDGSKSKPYFMSKDLRRILKISNRID